MGVGPVQAANRGQRKQAAMAVSGSMSRKTPRQSTAAAIQAARVGPTREGTVQADDSSANIRARRCCG